MDIKKFKRHGNSQATDENTKVYSDKTTNPSRLREALSIVGILLVAIALAILLSSYVFRSYDVDGTSMEPTLQNQDKLIIWKVPRTWAMITGHQYVPKRGDIIVFNESNLAVCGQPSSTKTLIKRVIGLPNDKVVIRDGIVTIYDKKHPKGFQPDNTLGYNKSHTIHPYDLTNETVQLNSHQLFVMGDNRSVSCDSTRFGPINTNQVIGQMVLRLLPISKVEAF